MTAGIDGGLVGKTAGQRGSCQEKPWGIHDPPNASEAAIASATTISARAGTKTAMSGVIATTGDTELPGDAANKPEMRVCHRPTGWEKPVSETSGQNRRRRVTQGNVHPVGQLTKPLDWTGMHV